MSVRTATEHRAELAKIMARVPANDSDIKHVLAWPTMARLAKARNAVGVRVLQEWARANQEYVVANDNHLDKTGNGIGCEPADR